MSAHALRLTVLVDHPAGLHRLRRAFRGIAGSNAALQVHLADSWAEAERRAKAGDFDLAVVDPSFRVESGNAIECLHKTERLGALCSPERLILYACRPTSYPALLHELGRTGFSFLSVLGVDDDPDSLLRMVVRAESRRLLREHLTLRGPHIAKVALSMLLQSLSGWPPATTVDQLARQVGTSPRSLRRIAARGGLAPPTRLLACGRILDLTVLGHLGVRSRDPSRSCP